jgi:hypothetical protein
MNHLVKKAALAVSSIASAALIFSAATFAASPSPTPLVSPSPSGGAQPFTLTPGIFDPDNKCPGIFAGWDNTVGNSIPSIKLVKPCTTATIAAPYVEIATGLEGGPITALTELNFDYLNGGHCGAGAPRFNVQVNGNTYFLGCTQGTHTAAGANWTHVVFNQADLAAAGVPNTGTLEDLYIIFDEGSDTASGGSIGTPGIVNIDNISINNKIVGQPAASVSPSPSASKDACKDAGYKVFQGQNGVGPFKNQGDCTSYFATKGKNKPSGTVIPSATP